MMTLFSQPKTSYSISQDTDSRKGIVTPTLQQPLPRPTAKIIYILVDIDIQQRWSELFTVFKAKVLNL